MAHKAINKGDKYEHKRWVDKKGRSRVATKRLTQQEFMAVEYHMQGFNMKEAMIKAGYSEKTASDQQTRFFRRKIISRAVDERRWAMKTRNNKMVDRIQDELAKIAFFNIGHVIEITEMGEIIFDYSEASMDDFAAIGEITVETYTEGRGHDAQEVKRVKCKPYDKKAALDSLARIHGMFNDKLALSSEENLEQRLHAGRARAGKLSAPDVIDASFEDITGAQDEEYDTFLDDEDDVEWDDD